MSCHSTHVGLAATRHARAVTDLDDAQVASIFHRLKRENKDTPAPSTDDALATLVRLRREVLDDPRLDTSTARALADRYAHAIEAVNNGDTPDGRTWAAMQGTVLEAEVAERNLDGLIRASARQQRTNAERMGATFRKWRRTDDYEDLESPDPQFIVDDTALPQDKHTRRALRKMGFENWLAQRLPVFVYGTLRNNQGNDRLMAGAIEQRSESAQVEGVAVYGARWGFPYANEAPDGQGVTKGDLVHLAEDHDGDWARQRLDSLEGFNSDRFSNSHYRRVTRTVSYTDTETGEQRTTTAWVYLAGRGSASTLSEADRIHDGDWVKAKDAHRAARDKPTYRDEAATEAEDDWTAGYVVKKSAVGTPGGEAHSAVDAAAVFVAAGLFDDEPAEHGGFWSQHS